LKSLGGGQLLTIGRWDFDYYSLLILLESSDVISLFNIFGGLSQSEVLLDASPYFVGILPELSAVSRKTPIWY
jgi:hypothetical protein